MHPISKLNFGPHGKIAVTYHNGTSVVAGYILKQVATKKFIVTTDGVTKFKCALAADGTPAAGELTIQVTPFGAAAEHVVSISTNHVDTAEGNRYIWTFENPTEAGYAKIAKTA